MSHQISNVISSQIIPLSAEAVTGNIGIAISNLENIFFSLGIDPHRLFKNSSAYATVNTSTGIYILRDLITLTCDNLRQELSIKGNDTPDNLLIIKNIQDAAIKILSVLLSIGFDPNKLNMLAIISGYICGKMKR
jgi:hypothetical protein